LKINRWIGCLILFVMFLVLPAAEAARTAFRLNSDPDLIDYYINNPDDYPICKSSLDFMHFDSPVSSVKRRLFDTNSAFVEIGAYGRSNGGFSASKCADAISLLRGYENAGFTVYGVFLYREEWLAVAGGGGPFDVDRRILSQSDINNFKSALAASTLKCKGSLKIFQLLGGRVKGELDTTRSDNGDSWDRMDAATKTYLEQFDGVGTECHTVDAGNAPGRRTLEAQADMALWAKNKNKESLVFMGGGGASYKDFDTQAATFNYLWDEMDAVGLDKRSPHLIYLRQGAHRNAVVYDDHLPESDDTKLTYQVKWMIENVREIAPSGPTSGLVAHWPLNEGSGTSTTDTSGSGSDAALLNGASWGSDATRSSHVVFDGNNDRIATAFTYALADTDKFTWAWWAKKDPTSHANSIMVGNRYGGTGSESLEFIKFMPSKASFANTGNSTSIEDYNYVDLPSNEWHHYAMVKNGTSCQWFVDGVAQGSPVTINYNETSPLPFLIGGDDDGSGTKVNEHFKGAIDDVVLYRSALSAAEVTDVMGGSYALTIPMAAAALGGPVNLIDGSTWEDGLPPHAGYNYLVPNTGNLRGASGTSSFPGYSLTVAAGGRFQVRALGESGELTTVDRLILKGGASFGAGGFAELAAGTGTMVTNVLDGAVINSGFSRFLSLGSSNKRSLEIRSQISGSGRIRASESSSSGLSSVIIGNDANTFSGTWEVDNGSRLVFQNAGAVGDADVEVLAGGTLAIQGDWEKDAILTVANAANTTVDVGPHDWVVSSLVMGGTTVAHGLYTTAELSGLGNAVFTGSGRITVGPPILVETVMAGWDFWNSNTAPTASVTAFGITATAAASTASGSWSNSDQNNDGRGSSGDQTWGSFAGNGLPASSVTSGAGVNMTAPNGVTDANITFTITNNGPTDWELDSFHMDVIAFRPNAPRAYQLEILSGDLTHGIVFTAPVDSINDLGGTIPDGNDSHDEIDIDLTALTDATLEPSGTAVIRITFSGGAGSAAGHHLFLDNVAFSGATIPLTEIESWRYEHFGIINSEQDDLDANLDGESNLLEFATGQDPWANTLVSTSLGLDGETLEFRYTRSKAALSEGMVFTVEWSDTLLHDSWSIVGVTEVTDPESPGNSEIENLIARMPAGSSGRRFMRLKISNP
jgi:hypothetical protein